MIDINKIKTISKEIDRTYAIDLRKGRTYDKVSLQNDDMFKTMFQNANRIKYPKYLLKLLFAKTKDLKFDDLKFYKTESNRKAIKDKGQKSDFVAVLDNKYWNIEINNCSTTEVIERNIEYAMRIYSNKSRVGMKYNYSTCIQVNINNFAYQNDDTVVDMFYIKNDKNEALTSKIIFIEIYIPNIIKKCYNEGVKSLNDLERYILVLALEDNEECKEIAKGDECMEEYINEATEVTCSHEFGESYDHAEFDRRLSYEYGVEDNKRECAINLIKNGIDLKIIAQCIGLPIEEIEKLKEGLKDIN